MPPMGCGASTLHVQLQQVGCAAAHSGPCPQKNELIQQSFQHPQEHGLAISLHQLPRCGPRLAFVPLPSQQTDEAAQHDHLEPALTSLISQRTRSPCQHFGSHRLQCRHVSQQVHHHFLDQKIGMFFLPSRTSPHHQQHQR